MCTVFKYLQIGLNDTNIMMKGVGDLDRTTLKKGAKQSTSLTLGDYCLWKDARTVYNLKSLFVPSLTTGNTSYNHPSTNTTVIIAPILVGMVMLLVGITLVVISVILIVKRKTHTPTVQYDKESKVPYFYDEVDDHVKSTKDTKVYQELDVNKMDDTKQYATIK